MDRRIILVSGAPGSGKSTVAGAVAGALNLPILSKDAIKEVLWEALDLPARCSGVPADNDLEWSRRLSRAAMEVMWALARQPAEVLVEANFRPRSEHERSRIEALDGRVVEIHCVCPPEEAARRFAWRATQPGHHAAHVLRRLDADMLAEYDGPVGVGPVICVDTTRPLQLERVLTAIEALRR